MGTHRVARVVLPVLMWLGGVGNGLTIGPNLTVTLAAADRSRPGAAAALLQTGQRLGSALGTAGAAALLYAHGTATASGTRGALVLCATLVGGAAVVATITAVREPRPGRPSST